ncbi:uncharacterized protein AruCF_3480 [Achromobacter ruhlandii]|nr:uncharacterized protein AruCF_3480 [Achromobacter ruhlandii]
MLDVRGYVQGRQAPVQGFIHQGYLHTKANGDTAPFDWGRIHVCPIILAAPGRPSTRPNGRVCHRVCHPVFAAPPGLRHSCRRAGNGG